MADKNGKQNKKNGQEEKPQIVHTAKGLAVAYAITVLVFLIYAAILTYTSVSEKNMGLVAIICTVAATIAAGFICAKGAKSRGFLWGLLSGGLYAVILFIISFLTNEEFAVTVGKVTTLLIALAGGGIGGILGINKK